MSKYLARFRSCFVSSRRFSTSIFATFVFLGLAQAATAQVFINEFHYDNAGTDTGEAIEVAGPAGTDLTGWTLVLYNGSTGVAYNTTNLSGTIANQQGGFGTIFVTYPTNGIQNGSPDGIAYDPPLEATDKELQAIETPFVPQRITIGKSVVVR